jgi:hypothetical protein
MMLDAFVRRADLVVRHTDSRTDTRFEMRIDSRASRAHVAARPLHWPRRMSNTRITCIASFLSSFSTLLVLLASTIVAASTACADEPPLALPDATPATSIDPSGTYAVTSAFALSATPDAAAPAIAELTAMSDGPDDPSRYLIDLMIAALPEGTTKSYATAVAPYVAAYVNIRLSQIAPRFVDGSHALGAGLTRIAQRFGTIETFEIAADGPRVEGDDYVAESKWLTRTITGARFEVNAGRDIAEVHFASLGLPDIMSKSLVTLDGSSLGGAVTDRPGTLSITKHTASLPYARMLRLGFDFAVIPDVVPGAHDLGVALAELVDCNRLGAAVAECVGLGSPTFYATACSAGLSAMAVKLYARLDAIEADAAALPLELVGQARAVDTNSDGAMDAISAGTWSGNVATIPATGSFEGTRR